MRVLKRDVLLFVLLVLGLAFATFGMSAGTTAAPTRPTLEILPGTPASEQPVSRFQIGAQATETGAAVSFWIDGNKVKMFYVLPDGQFYPNEMQDVTCDVIQATVAIGGNVATVFMLCANGETQMARFGLYDTFTAHFASSTRLYLPMIVR